MPLYLHEDAHPIRNWLQKGDERYEGEKGFSKLAGDIGTGVKILGGVIAIGAPPVGAAIYEVGAALGDVGDAYDAAIDLKNGETEKAAITGGALLLGTSLVES